MWIRSMLTFHLNASEMKTGILVFFGGMILAYKADAQAPGEMAMDEINAAEPAAYATTRCSYVECSGTFYTRCNVPGARRVYSVQLIKNNSTSSCTEDSEYGFYFGDVWVDRGCGGWFRACYWLGSMTQVLCSSTNGYRRYCYVGNMGEIYAVTLYSQHSSSSPCIFEHSFGQLGERYIWVEKGCGATFRVYRTPASLPDVFEAPVQREFLDDIN